MTGVNRVTEMTFSRQCNKIFEISMIIGRSDKRQLRQTDRVQDNAPSTSSSADLRQNSG